MVIYVDGKPIFVENPKLSASSHTLQNETGYSTKEHDKLQLQPEQFNSSFSDGLKSKISKSKSLTNANVNKPVTKIPYLLAAAAAAAAQNHRKQSMNINSNSINNNIQQLEEQKRIIESNECTRTLGIGTSLNKHVKELKHDQEYMQLVSMFRQKNAKLYNPLLNKSF